TALEEAPVVEPMRSTARKTILVVDDEPDVATLLAEALALDGHQVDTVHNGSDALERLRGRGYQLSFSDMKMPGMSGAEFYRTVARNLPAVERRMISVTGDSMNVTTLRFLEETGPAGRVARRPRHASHPPSRGRRARASSAGAAARRARSCLRPACRRDRRGPAGGSPPRPGRAGSS